MEGVGGGRGRNDVNIYSSSKFSKTNKKPTHTKDVE